MGLGLNLLSGAVSLAADWKRKGVDAKTAAHALLELAGCAAIAAGITEKTFHEMADVALLAAKDSAK